VRWDAGNSAALAPAIVHSVIVRPREPRSVTHDVQPMGRISRWPIETAARIFFDGREISPRIRAVAFKREASLLLGYTRIEPGV